jgi:hypothetical protein
MIFIYYLLIMHLEHILALPKYGLTNCPQNACFDRVVRTRIEKGILNPRA